MSPLISAVELLEKLESDTTLTVVDCRFSLGAAAQGELDYQEAHVPGAVYAHLDRDLSGPVVPGHTGRHPLPEVNDLVRRFENWGIGNESHVVVYDDSSGAFASRLWWLLHYLGHDRVQVLDGGLAAYKGANGVLSGEIVHPDRQTFVPDTRQHMLASLEEVAERTISDRPALFDARARDRFRGENETIDARPGHIPGARSLPFQDNLRDGFFLPEEELRVRLESELGDDTARAIVYCGSGVTACHNILAAMVARIPPLRLYAGSYSEWIADEQRQVELGE